MNASLLVLNESAGREHRDEAFPGSRRKSLRVFCGGGGGSRDRKEEVGADYIALWYATIC